MRSKPGKSNMGKVAVVLAILAAAWLALGTAFLFSFRYWIRNNTIASAPESAEVQEEEEDESDVNDFDDEGTDLDDDMKDDQDFYDDEEINEKYGDDPDDDDFDDDDDLTDEDDEDDEEDDDDDTDSFVQTFTVDAWDGFAAVRTGRGTGYTEVGRLNNGEKVKVKDLENGWYEIASGKWKGYYLHKSSLK